MQMSSKYKVSNELSNEEIKSIFDNSLFYTETVVEEQEPCIWVQESEFRSTVGSIGNISTIVGKPKAGKTFVVSAFVVALLKATKCLKFIGKLQSNKSKILLIDTEQSKRDCSTVMQRISKMYGTPGKHPENLIYVRQRGKLPSTIVKVVEYGILNNPDIGVVIIDGIKDLIYSINDEHEATEISSKLLEWSEKKGIHIITVIHQNKMDNNTRGHIGTELENKSESVIIVKKHERDKSLMVVEAKLMRGQEFESFAFRIKDGLPELSDEEIKENKKSKRPEDYNDDFHLNLLEYIFPENNNCSGRDFQNCLIKTLKKFDLNISDKPARDFTNYYIENQILINKGSESKQKLIINENYKVR